MRSILVLAVVAVSLCHEQADAGRRRGLTRQERATIAGRPRVHGQEEIGADPWIGDGQHVSQRNGQHVSQSYGQHVSQIRGQHASQVQHVPQAQDQLWAPDANAVYAANFSTVGYYDSSGLFVPYDTPVGAPLQQHIAAQLPPQVRHDPHGSQPTTWIPWTWVSNIPYAHYWMPEHFYAQQYNQFAEVERMRQVEQIRAARMLMEQRDLAQQRIQVETQAALARHEMAMRQKQQYLHRLQRLQAQNLEWRQQGEHWRREHSRTTSEGSSGRSSSPWGDVLPTISYEGAHGLATPSQRTDYAHSVSTVQNSEMDLADESGSAIDGDQIVSGPRNDLAIQSQMDVTASNIVVCEIDTMADDTDYEDALSYAEWIAGDDDNTDVFEDTVADDSLSQSQAQVAASSKKSKKKQQRHQKQQRQRETQTQNVRQPCTPSSTTASSISSWSETITAWWRHWTRRPKRKVDVGKMYRRRLAEANRDVPAKKDKGGHFPSTPDEQKIADGYIQHMRNNEKLLLEFAPRAITEFVESLKIMRWSLEHHQMLIIRRLRKATIGLKNILRSFDPEWNAAQRLILPRRYATDLVDPKRRRRVEPYAMDHMPNLAAMESLNNVMWLYESYAEAIFKQYAACSWFVPLTSYSNAFFDPRTNPGWGAIIDRTVPQSTDAMALAYLKQLGLYDPPIENVKMKIKQSKGKK